MTGSAVLADGIDSAEVFATEDEDEDDPGPVTEPVEPVAEKQEIREGYPIAIALDATGFGMATVGVFPDSIETIEFSDGDDLLRYCTLQEHPTSAGVSVIEISGSHIKSRPVSGIVIVK